MHNVPVLYKMYKMEDCIDPTSKGTSDGTVEDGDTQVALHMSNSGKAPLVPV